jgi:hypothetical protein
MHKPVDEKSTHEEAVKVSGSCACACVCTAGTKTSVGQGTYQGEHAIVNDESSEPTT